MAVVWMEDKYEFPQKYLKKLKSKPKGRNRSLRTAEKHACIPQEPSF